MIPTWYTNTSSQSSRGKTLWAQPISNSISRGKGRGWWLWNIGLMRFGGFLVRLLGPCLCGFFTCFTAAIRSGRIGWLRSCVRIGRRASFTLMTKWDNIYIRRKYSRYEFLEQIDTDLVEVTDKVNKAFQVLTHNEVVDLALNDVPCTLVNCFFPTKGEVSEEIPDCCFKELR